MGEVSTSGNAPSGVSAASGSRPAGLVILAGSAVFAVAVFLDWGGYKPVAPGDPNVNLPASALLASALFYLVPVLVAFVPGLLILNGSRDRVLGGLAAASGLISLAIAVAAILVAWGFSSGPAIGTLLAAVGAGVILAGCLWALLSER